MKNNYKSKTFLSGFADWKNFSAFIQDIHSIKDVGERNQSFEELARKTINYIFTIQKNDGNSILQELIESNFVNDKEQFEALVRVSSVFLELFITPKRKNDTIEDLIHDLSIASETDINEFKSFKQLLTCLKDLSSFYEGEKKREKVKAGIMPYLNGFNTTVELRASFNKDFEIGDDLNDYKDGLKLEDQLDAIISVNITLDSGTPEDFCFQASPDNLLFLINELQSAIYKSEILKNNIIIKKQMESNSPVKLTQEDAIDLPQLNKLKLLKYRDELLSLEEQTTALLDKIYKAKEEMAEDPIPDFDYFGGIQLPKTAKPRTFSDFDRLNNYLVFADKVRNDLADANAAQKTITITKMKSQLSTTLIKDILKAIFIAGIGTGIIATFFFNWKIGLIVGILSALLNIHGVFYRDHHFSEYNQDEA